jgi:hypothetical protein
VGAESIHQVSVFRPYAVIDGPRGQQWEIYVSRIRPPQWRRPVRRNRERYGRFALLFALPLVVLNRLLWPLLAVPRAIIVGLRSPTVRVEAMTHLPQREIYLWTTTRGRERYVADEIAAGLAVGTIAEPAGARYHGTAESRGLIRDPEGPPDPRA